MGSHFSDRRDESQNSTVHPVHPVSEQMRIGSSSVGSWRMHDFVVMTRLLCIQYAGAGFVLSRIA